MWIFDERVAVHRKQQKFVICLRSGLASLVGRRNGRICTSDAPIVFPLDPFRPAKVMVEYNDNLGVPRLDEMIVSDIEPKDTNIKGELVVIAGQNIGSLVRWIRRTGGKTRVYRVGEDKKKDAFNVLNEELCAVE